MVAVLKMDAGQPMFEFVAVKQEPADPDPPPQDFEFVEVKQEWPEADPEDAPEVAQDLNSQGSAHSVKTEQAEELIVGTAPGDGQFQEWNTSCEAPTLQRTQTTQEINYIIIKTNSDQNTPTWRNIIPVRVDNKAAERSRLYRERHREEINRRRRNTRQHQKHGSVQVRMDKAALSSRLYRERHREEINRRRRDVRRRQQNSQQVRTAENTDDSEQITPATLNNQPSSNSYTQGQPYCGRHEEEINTHVTDLMLKEDIPKPVAATATERSRKYRERNREEINKRKREERLRQKNSQQIHVDCNVNNIDTIEQITQAPLINQPSSYSYTQRQQQYYESHNEEINKHETDIELMQKIPKPVAATATERNRKYRERNREEINKRQREKRLCQKNTEQIHVDCSINNIDTIEQIRNATANC